MRRSPPPPPPPNFPLLLSKPSSFFSYSPSPLSEPPIPLFLPCDAYAASLLESLFREPDSCCPDVSPLAPRTVEYIMMLVMEAYDDESTSSGKEVEQEAADMCRELYTLCLDMVVHVEDVSSGLLDVADINNVDGIKMLEALAYKVAAAAAAAEEGPISHAAEPCLSSLLRFTLSFTSDFPSSSFNLILSPSALLFSLHPSLPLSLLTTPFPSFHFPSSFSTLSITFPRCLQLSPFSPLPPSPPLPS